MCVLFVEDCCYDNGPFRYPFALRLRYRRIDVDVETLQEMYVGALGDSKFDSAELSGTHALDERTPIALNPRYSENCITLDAIFVGVVTCYPMRESVPLSDPLG